MANKKPPRFFDLNRPGRGVTKQAAEKDEKKRYSFGNFFVLTGRNISLLFLLNLLFLFTNLFLFSALIAMTGNFDTTHLVPAGTNFQTLYGITRYGFTPASVSQWGIFGTLSAVGYASTTTKILYGISFLTLFTFGPTSAGLAYVLRGVVRGDYVDLGDYFKAIRKNFVQALFGGIVDLCITGVFLYAIYFYFLQQSAGGFGFQLLYFLALFFFFIYLMMRFHFYLLIVTFKLSLWKAIKNSYILTVAGIKRNILALIGCGLTVGINIVLFILLPPIGAILPFIFTVSFLSLMATFAAYPTIKRLMIDPYYPDQTPPENAEEAVFTDMG